MNSASKITILSAIVIAAAVTGLHEVTAQVGASQNLPASLPNKIQAANEECRRKYPDQIRQSVAYATCENRNLELLRPTMVYPDLIDQELANNLLLAEKVQTGKMTPIEMKALKAQLHSQIVSEFQRRQLARTAAMSRPNTPAANPGSIPGQAALVQPNPLQPRSQAPRELHCQTARFGMLLGTECN